MLGDGPVDQASAFAEEQQFMQMWAHQGAIVPTVKPVDWFDTKKCACSVRLIDHVTRLCFDHFKKLGAESVGCALWQTHQAHTGATPPGQAHWATHGGTPRRRCREA